MSYGVWKHRFPILVTSIINVKLSSSQNINVNTTVLHNIACNLSERLPRVTTEIESLIQITDFSNSRNNIGRHFVNNNRQD